MVKSKNNLTINRPPSNSSADKKNARSIKFSGVNSFTSEMREWYNQPEADIAACISQLIQKIDSNNVQYRDRMMRYARLYGNYEVLGMANLSASDTFRQTNNLPVFNVVQSCVDTMNSKIARDNPKPYFITSGADYFDKVKAEKMTQFIQGVFQGNKLYEKANNKVFRDASVYGLGALQFFHNKHSDIIDCEWVFIDELKFDMYDAAKGMPRSMHRCKMIPKEMLISMYPEEKETIESVSTHHPSLFTSNDTVIDFVIYTESWHLANEQNTGRHVVSIADKTILDEEYEEDWFPIAFFQFYQKPLGLCGRGIPETIMSGQVEINKILLAIQQCQELQARPVIVVENDAQISSDSILNNRIARLIKIKAGTNPPLFLSPQGAAPEMYEYVETWINRCYSEVGLSQMTAGGQKTPGVNSAVAMRTQVDIESSRFIQVSKNWEQFFVDCAEICVKIGKKVFEKDKEWIVKYTDNKSKIIKEMPWKKINLPDDMYVIKCDTISSFPSSAAGRIQTITEFISNGYISQERGMEMLQLDPDLEGEINLRTASLRLCEMRLCDMVEENKYAHPEAYMNLQLSLSVSVATYNQLIIDHCPEDRLQLVRQWIGEIAKMITGQDPTTQLLQQTFGGAGAAPAQTPPPPVAPQAGINPNG